EIPDRLATEIERWLEAGGVDYPQIPGLDSVPAVDMCGVDECVKTEAVNKPDVEACSTDTTCSDVSQLAEATVVPSAPQPGPDPVANTVAGMVLASMVIVLGYALVSTTQAEKKGGAHPAQQVPVWQVWLIPVLALFGLGVATYLAYAKLAHAAVVCGPVGDCDAVQASSYSELLGIPVAILGALTYVAVLGMWFVAVWQQNKRNADLARFGLFGLALIGTLFSLYLTFLEPFVIEAVCAWCLTSASIITLILLISTHILVRQTLSPVAQQGDPLP
ncbi:MAG: vitamin K epoxide reductase family protein, partial [Chloroflexi bacterium]